MDIEELPSHMRQAGNLADRAGAGELAEPGIAVAVHPAAEAHQMRLRMLGIAVGREAVPRRRWRAAPPGPLVPDIGPDPSRRCLAGSRREYLDRGIVGEQGPASQHMAPDGVGQGYDAGKKIKGRKRHALVDNDGRGLVLEAHPASIQDRDGARPLLCASRGSFPFIEKVFADSGYAGEKVATATVIAVEIVRKSPDQVGFAVQPRRWVVERFFAWINRNRRLAKDFEATIASARAFLYAASVMLLVRRLARAARLSKPTLIDIVGV